MSPLPSYKSCNQTGCNYPQGDCAGNCNLHTADLQYQDKQLSYEPASLEPTPEILRRWARKAWHALGSLLLGLFIFSGYILAAWQDDHADNQMTQAKNAAYVKGYYAAKADAVAVQRLFCGSRK
jgi:hypothetical protein